MTATDLVLAPAAAAAPVATPPLVSLETSSRWVNASGPGEWESGTAYLPECTAQPDNPYWWSCHEEALSGEAPAHTKAVGVNADSVRWRPFEVFDGIACSTFSYRAEEWAARARRLLAVRTSQYVERELWTGAVAQAAGLPNDYLLDTPTVLTGPQGLRGALGELEQAVADNYDGRPATIHAMPRTVSLWAGLGLLIPSESRRQLRTHLGTLVVPGTGYPGTGAGDDGAAEKIDSAYAYVTGIVDVVAGPVRVLAAEGFNDATFDTAVNDFVVRVERTVMYQFDPCLKHGIVVNHTTEL